MVQSDDVPRPAFQSEIVEAGAGATEAFSMIQRALAEARLEREDIECLAIGLGPGSYTGIRVAIAIAQGWQLGRNVKLLGIATSELLAAQARAGGERGRVNIVIDAQRQEFYLAGWETGGDQRTEVEPLHIIPKAELLARADAGENMIGPSLKRWLPGARELYPSAKMLGRLALARRDYVSGEKLKPVYLRETTFVKAPPPRQV